MPASRLRFVSLQLSRTYYVTLVPTWASVNWPCVSYLTRLGALNYCRVDGPLTSTRPHPTNLIFISYHTIATLLSDSIDRSHTTPSCSSSHIDKEPKPLPNIETFVVPHCLKIACHLSFVTHHNSFGFPSMSNSRRRLMSRNSTSTH